MAAWRRGRKQTHAPDGAMSIHLEGTTVRIGPARYNVPVDSAEDAAGWVVEWGQLANVPADQAERARELAQSMVDVKMGNALCGEPSIEDDHEWIRGGC